VVRDLIKGHFLWCVAFEHRDKQAIQRCFAL